VVGFPRVIRPVTFPAYVTVCCVGFDEWCEATVVGAVESAFTFYPYGVGVSFFFAILGAWFTVVA
jgi:hypothetical protein